MKPIEIIHHRLPNIFIARNTNQGDVIVTRNIIPESSSSETEEPNNNEVILSVSDKEYRIWNPFQSILASVIVGGISQFGLAPGKNVLILGCAISEELCHISNIIGLEGTVYGVETSKNQHDMNSVINRAKHRHNIFPIIGENVRKPEKYNNLIQNNIDVIIVDLNCEDQVDIMAIHAQYFMMKKQGGDFILGVDASESTTITPTPSPESIYVEQVMKIRNTQIMKPKEQLTLEPYRASFAVIAGKIVKTDDGGKSANFVV
jgi:fibrillarin-like rRNA methylase